MSSRKLLSLSLLLVLAAGYVKGVTSFGFPCLVGTATWLRQSFTARGPQRDSPVRSNMFQGTAIGDFVALVLLVPGLIGFRLWFRDRNGDLDE